jgi:hypothetical protein
MIVHPVIPEGNLGQARAYRAYQRVAALPEGKYRTAETKRYPPWTAGGPGATDHAVKYGAKHGQDNHFWQAGEEHPGWTGSSNQTLNPVFHKRASLIQERVKTEQEMIDARYRKKFETRNRFKEMMKQKKRKTKNFGGRDADDPFAQLAEAVSVDYEKMEVDNPHEGEDDDDDDDDDDDEDEEEEELKRESDGKGLRYVDLFNPRQKGAGQLFVFVGKSERGKTHMLRYLLYHGCSRENDPYQFGLIFVRTKFKSAYKFHKLARPYVRIYEGFLLETLKAYVRNLEQRYKKYGKLEPSFIVFDDLVGVLNNDNAWFQNFIGTYRHYNITIFIAVQYLTGRHAISPIMREQTTAALMWNSKTHITNENLFKNYGQLFPDLRAFTRHFYNMTDLKLRGTRHACMVYFEWQDEIRKNYMSWLAPAELPDGQVIVKGPDINESGDLNERNVFLGEELGLNGAPFIKQSKLKSDRAMYAAFKKLYVTYQKRKRGEEERFNNPGPVPFNQADMEHIVRRLRDLHKNRIPRHLKQGNHLHHPNVHYFAGDYYLDWQARVPTTSDGTHPLANFGPRPGAHRAPVWDDGRKDPKRKSLMSSFQNWRQGNESRTVPTLRYQLPRGVHNINTF